MSPLLRAVVLGSMLAGCETPPAVPTVRSSPPVPRPSHVEAPRPAAGVDDTANLKVTESGAEPRMVRRYAFAVGRTDKRVLTLRQSAGHEGGPPAQEVVLAVTVDFTPKALEPQATKFEMKILGVDLPDLQLATGPQVQQHLAMFGGLTGAFDISPRGEAGEIEFKTDDRITGEGAEVIVQSLKASSEWIVPPFPVEAVGLGAKWQRKVELREGAQLSRSTHSFTLTQVSADGGIVIDDVELIVPEHPFKVPRGPIGAVEVVTGRGSYTYAFKLDHVATKVSGEMKIRRRLDLPDARGGPNVSTVEIITLKNQLDTVTVGAAPPPKR